MWSKSLVNPLIPAVFASSSYIFLKINLLEICKDLLMLLVTPAGAFIAPRNHFAASGRLHELSAYTN